MKMNVGHGEAPGGGKGGASPTGPYAQVVKTGGDGAGQSSGNTISEASPIDRNAELRPAPETPVPVQVRAMPHSRIEVAESIFMEHFHCTRGWANIVANILFDALDGENI